jgi:choice-of-anchor B domain-containing protein
MKRFDPECQGAGCDMQPEARDAGSGVTPARDGGVGTKPPPPRPRDGGFEPTASFEVTPTRITFEDRLDDTITIRNTGEVELTLALASSEPWATADPSTVTVAPNDMRDVRLRVDPSAMSFGLAVATVEVTNERAPPVEVLVRLVVREPYDPAPPAGRGLSVVGFTFDESDPEHVHLLVQFSRSVNTNTLDLGSFRVTEAGAEVLGTLTYDTDSRQARFVPDAPLVPDVVYNLRIATSVRARDGTALDQNDYRPGDQPFDRDFDRSMPVLRLEKFIPMAGVGDVWIDDRWVYVAGRSSGSSVWIVDAHDLPNADVAARIRDRGFVQDVKAGNGLLWASNEPGGVRIFDVSDPANPQYIRRIYDDNTQSVHNVYVEGNHLLASSNNTGRIEIYDVWNPAVPMPIGSISNPNGGAQIHDQMVFGNRVYGAFLDGGLTIADFTDPTNVTTIVDLSYPEDFCHNAWPSKDEQYLFTSDEVVGGPMRVWDISDVRNPTQVATYTAHPSSVIHNILVAGDLAYISFYTQGLRIVDVTDPPNPREVQFFDTYPSGDAFVTMNGAWGVHFEDEIVAISDMDTGLYLFRFEP